MRLTVFLTDVYHSDTSYCSLYQLLKEREDSINISHVEMPTWAEHNAFVSSRPYAVWCMIDIGESGSFVGSVYLTKQDEIGVFIFRNCRGRGYGKQAVRLLMEQHPRKRYLANINPDNGPSIAMFKGMGFAHIQNIFELRP